MEEKDQFIDADTDFHQESNKFEEIINRQIQRTTDMLSEDLSSMTAKKNQSTMYYEDKRVRAINHIKVLKTLLNTFLKEKHLEKINKILKNIKNYTEEQGNKIILVRGKGKLKIKDLNEDSIYYRKLQDFKVEEYEEIFQVLIDAYNENRSEIRAAEIE